MPVKCTSYLLSKKYDQTIEFFFICLNLGATNHQWREERGLELEARVRLLFCALYYY